MSKRLTIKSGELCFYEKVYNKCSNKNSPEVKKKANAGIPYYDIKEYKYKEYSSKELSDIYSKLSKLEDILEDYGFESLEELEETLEYYEYAKELRNERDIWRKACKLACAEIPDADKFFEFNGITKQDDLYDKASKMI